MRRIGTLTDGSQAKRFCDYLVTQAIEAMAEEDLPRSAAGSDGPGESRSGAWNIWIREESHVDHARAEFADFQAQPDAAKYQVASKADEIRHQKVAEEQRRRKQQQANAQRAAPSAPVGGMRVGRARQQKIPVTIAIIAISVLCSFATNFGRPKPSQIAGQYSSGENLYGALSFVDWRDFYHSGDDPFASIRKGEVWRFITPMFMHGSTMHLAFNMMGVFFLGSVIERIQGSVFLAILALATHVIGTIVQVMLPGAEALPAVLSELAGTPFAIGASGSLYGLFGYLWVRPSLDPDYPIQLDQTNVMIMLAWLVACIFVVKGIANGAHIGGFVAGIIAAMLVVQFTKQRAK
jgi:GlpG protein